MACKAENGSFLAFFQKESLLSSVLHDWDRDMNNKSSTLLLTFHSIKEMIGSRRRIREFGGGGWGLRGSCLDRTALLLR